MNYDFESGVGEIIRLRLAVCESAIASRSIRFIMLVIVFFSVIGSNLPVALVKSITSRSCRWPSSF